MGAIFRNAVVAIMVHLFIKFIYLLMYPLIRQRYRATLPVSDVKECFNNLRSYHVSARMT